MGRGLGTYLLWGANSHSLEPIKLMYFVPAWEKSANAQVTRLWNVPRGTFSTIPSQRRPFHCVWVPGFHTPDRSPIAT